MEDQMFILSMEEAVKYRDVLWKFNGSSQNNPQSQYSAYSKGYYLRTPQYGGEDVFQYGKVSTWWIWEMAACIRLMSLTRV